MRQKFNLNPRERAVISRMQFASESSAAQVAGSVGSTAPAVAYDLRSLQDRGILKRRAVINFYRLGYTNFVIFFCMESETNRQHEKVLKHLVAHPQVAWLGLLAGEYHYGLAFLAREASEVQQLLLDASERYDVSFAHKTIVPRLEITFYSRSYLQEKPGKRQEFTLKSVGPPLDCDEIDQKILGVLANGDYRSLRDVAQKLGLRSSRVERRVKLMQKKGVILSRMFGVNSDLLGMNSFRLLIRLHRLSAQSREAIRTFCRGCANVVLLMECLGEWDFEIDVEVANAREVGALTRQLYESCGPDLSRVQTLTELEDLKYSLYPFSGSV